MRGSCYQYLCVNPQGDGFSTSLSRLLHDSDTLKVSLRSGISCIVLGVVVGGMVMCYPGRR